MPTNCQQSASPSVINTYWEPTHPLPKTELHRARRRYRSPPLLRFLVASKPTDDEPIALGEEQRCGIGANGALPNAIVPAKTNLLLKNRTQEGE